MAGAAAQLWDPVWQRRAGSTDNFSKGAGHFSNWRCAEFRKLLGAMLAKPAAAGGASARLVRAAYARAPLHLPRDTAAADASLLRGLLGRHAEWQLACRARQERGLGELGIHEAFVKPQRKAAAEESLQSAIDLIAAELLEREPGPHMVVVGPLKAEARLRDTLMRLTDVRAFDLADAVEGWRDDEAFATAQLDEARRAAVERLRKLALRRAATAEGRSRSNEASSSSSSSSAVALSEQRSSLSLLRAQPGVHLFGVLRPDFPHSDEAGLLGVPDYKSFEGAGEWEPARGAASVEGAAIVGPGVLALAAQSARRAVTAR